MTIQTIGEALAARLYAAENAIDRALVETAAMTAFMPGAQEGARLPPSAGHAAMQENAAAVAALIDARARVVSAHEHLARLATELGLDTLAAGPVDKPHDTPPIGKTKARSALATG